MHLINKVRDYQDKFTRWVNNSELAEYWIRRFRNQIGAIGTYQEAAFGGRMYNQGLFELSSTQKHPLGFIRPLADGRVFVYAKNGAAELAAGLLNVSPTQSSYFLNQVVGAVAALDAKRVYLTPGAGTATENYYRDGYLNINDCGSSTGEAYAYKVRGHLAVSSATAFWCELYDSLRVALTTSSEWTLVADRQQSVIVYPYTAVNNLMAGVAPLVVTASYYFWHQVKGPCSVLTNGTVIAGCGVMPSDAVAGSVEHWVPEADTSTEVESAGPVGWVMSVNADTEYSLIWLNIPGY